MTDHLGPICARCFDLMVIVTVHHAHRPATRWPVCRACLTTRHLDQTDLPIDIAPAPAVRHLRAVR